MVYTPIYLAEETARKYLGNTAAANIHSDMDEAAMRFADSFINSKIGIAVPSTSIHFGSAVGIAYLLYKVQRQTGNATEAQRKLDWEIATAALKTLEENMVATGEIGVLTGGASSLMDDISPMDEYLTAPLNENGITVFGAKTLHGVATTQQGRSRIITTPQDG